MSNDTPSTTDSNGRDNNGRFAAGNQCAKGNPFAKRVAEFRAALMSAVTREDLVAVAKALLKKALTGDVSAATLLLNRLLGPTEALDVLTRLEELDEKVTLLQARNGKL